MSIYHNFWSILKCILLTLFKVDKNWNLIIPKLSFPLSQKKKNLNLTILGGSWCDRISFKVFFDS